MDQLDFMPAGECLQWVPLLIGTHVVSDLLIALACFSIPVSLLYLVRNRESVAFHWMFLLFAGFIFLIGTVHLIEILTVWIPAYRLDGAVKVVTAGVSCATAIALYPTVSRSVGGPDLRTLHSSNVELRSRVDELNLMRRELEQQTTALKRSNRELEEFAYVASHDLQEPLRMIVSYMQLLKSRYGDRFDKDAEEFMFYAVDGAERMQELINDLLSLSRVTTRARPMKEADLNAVVERALHNLKVSIDESNAEVNVGELPTLKIDEGQFVKLFQNLIHNAIKFSGEGKPEIGITAQAGDEEWIVSVADRGIGIDPSYHNQVFQVFKTLQAKSGNEGTGIGLALCKKIVERHGGRIQVESEEGKGAIFRIAIPIHPPDIESCNDK